MQYAVSSVQYTVCSMQYAPVHDIGCPLPAPTGILTALPVIGYRHGYAQGEWAGGRAGALQISDPVQVQVQVRARVRVRARARARVQPVLRPGTGGNIKEAGGLQGYGCQS